MVDRAPFDVPDATVVDPWSGYTLNLPLGPQDYPGWQEDKPEVVSRLQVLRKSMNIEVPDDQWSKKPTLTTVTKPKNAKKAPLPKRVKR